jgi:ABC-2 type transport system ATP-binding protein
MARILYPNKGSITVSGRLCALLELGAGFHPELSGRENVFLNGAILGMSKKDIEKRFDEIVEFAGIETFIDSPVKNYSNGMQVRLGFSIAANVEPEILLIDEVLAVGDANFQRKCGEKIESFRAEGRTIILVSHGLPLIEQLCDQTAWLEKGVVRQIGNSVDVIAEYTGESLANTTRSDGELGSRRGNGAVRVEKVRLIDARGAETTSFKTGDRLTIDIEYEAQRLLTDTVFSVRISTLHGSEVWTSNSRRHGNYIERLRESGTVSLDIPELPLLEGTYDVSVLVTDKTEQKVYDWLDRQIRFDVVSGLNPDSGILTIGSNWAVDGARR